MQVREAMSEAVLTIGPDHTLREAAAAMLRRNVGAAVVLDPDAPGPGVITERDILKAVGSGEDPRQPREQGSQPLHPGQGRHRVFVLRVEPEGLPVLGHGPVQVPLLLQDERQGVVGRDISWVEEDGRPASRFSSPPAGATWPCSPATTGTASWCAPSTSPKIPCRPG